MGHGETRNLSLTRGTLLIIPRVNMIYVAFISLSSNINVPNDFRADYNPQDDLLDQEFMLRGRWFHRKDLEVIGFDDFGTLHR